MDIDTFYTDHWREIEDERVERYEQMFVWQDAQAKLLEPSALAPGHTVLDVGAGPGFFASGVAGLVAPGGRVHGVDINQRFVDDANQRFADDERLQFHHLTDHHLPFADATFDRVICKNVLEYVPDISATLDEIVRVLKPGGRLQVIDSDWGCVIVEPWAPHTVTRFFEAASPAFNEPYVGRRIAARMADAGLGDVVVRMSPFADQSGRGLHVLRNMASYINTFATLPAEEVDELLGQVEQALANNRFLFCLPQFLVTGDKTNKA